MEALEERILDAVKRQLQAARGDWPRVALESGVPYHTITKIAQGQVEDPRVGTVQRLIDYFDKQRPASGVLVSP